MFGCWNLLTLRVFFFSAAIVDKYTKKQRSLQNIYKLYLLVFVALDRDEEKPEQLHRLENSIMAERLVQNSSDAA